jgi:hypothetical protein
VSLPDGDAETLLFAGDDSVDEEKLSSVELPGVDGV